MISVFHQPTSTLAYLVSTFSYFSTYCELLLGSSNELLCVPLHVATLIGDLSAEDQYLDHVLWLFLEYDI